MNKFSTVMTSPGPAFQECTGSCHVNVPAPKVVSSQSAIDRWSDCIGHLVGDSCHLGTLSTILQHFTHNETQWPNAARQCHFAVSLCSEAQQTSWPQVILKCQPPICLDYRSGQTDPAHTVQNGIVILDKLPRTFDTWFGVYISWIFINNT